MKNIFKSLIHYSIKRRKGITFLIFLSFMITFAMARLFVVLTHNNVHIIVAGYHIHHIVLGIILLIVAGGVSIGFKNGFIKISAVTYGAGLGLITDEVGLLISWGDYWNRLTYDTLIMVVLIFLNSIMFSEFWRNIGRKLFMPSIIKYEKKWNKHSKKIREELRWYHNGKRITKKKRKI